MKPQIIKMNKNFNKDRILKSASTPREWFNLDTSEEIPDMYIYDQIGQDWWGDGLSPLDFISEVKKIKTDKFNLHINSPGGFVYDGLTVYNGLNVLDKYITVYIDGIAASMASVVAMVGDNIIMPVNADFMLHDPWSCMCGTADNFEKEAKELRRLKDSILGIYVARTSATKEELSKLMSEESWISGTDALELGLADEIIENKKAAACVFDLNIFESVPEHHMKLNIAKNKRNLEQALRDAGYSHSEAKKIAGGQRDAENKIKDKKIEKKPLTIIVR